MQSTDMWWNLGSTRRSAVPRFPSILRLSRERSALHVSWLCHRASFVLSSEGVLPTKFSGVHLQRGISLTHLGQFRTQQAHQPENRAVAQARSESVVRKSDR